MRQSITAPMPTNVHQGSHDNTEYFEAWKIQIGSEISGNATNYVYGRKIIQIMVQYLNKKTPRYFPKFCGHNCHWLCCVANVSYKITKPTDETLRSSLFFMIAAADSAPGIREIFVVVVLPPWLLLFPSPLLLGLLLLCFFKMPYS